MIVQDAKAWLLRYQSIARDLETAVSRLETMRYRLESAKTPRLDGMPHSPGFDRDHFGAALVQMEELEAEAEELRAEARALYKEIDGTIAQISGPGWPDRRAVLRMRYLDGEKWEVVTRMLFGHEPDFDDRMDSFLRRVHKIHSAALAALCELIPPETKILK